jgi:hypothetical protein
LRRDVYLPGGDSLCFRTALLLSALSTLALIRFLQQPSTFRAVIRPSLIAAFDTHLAAVLLILPILLISQKRRSVLTRWLICAGIAVLLALPWLAIIQNRIAFLRKISSTVTIALISTITRRRYRAGWWRSSTARSNLRLRNTSVTVVTLVVLFSAIGSALLLERKPAWIGAIDRLNDSRQPSEPALTILPPPSALAHYDRLPQTHIRQGISVDLSWREFTAEEIRQIVAAMDDSPSVWLIMPIDDPLTSVVIDAVAATRYPAYRLSENGVLFFRFDHLTGDPRF